MYPQAELEQRRVLQRPDAMVPRRWQALVAATRSGAAICGVGNELGTIEVGKLADLIVVGANPLEDINNVRRLQLMLKEGVVVSDRRQFGQNISGVITF